MRSVGARVALLTVMTVAGCASVPEAEFATYRSIGDRPATYRGLAVRSGQIIVGESGGAMSLLFRLFEERFHPYLHAGVIVREEGEYYVYHAMGTIKPSFGDVPSDTVTGGVRREPLLRYLAKQAIVAIYDPPRGVDAARVAAFVRDARARGVPFDPYFDAGERERLYCAELVAAALEAGGSAPIPRRPRKANASLDVVLDWLKIRATDMFSPADLIHPDRQVALVSRRHSAREIELYFAARAELHRRFTEDQRLGHLFVWTGLRLDFRESVAEFQRAALSLPVSNTAADPESARRVVSSLAERMFGAFPRVATTPTAMPAADLMAR